MKKILPLLLIFAATFSFTLAQTPTTADVKGFVYDKATGEPAIFINVVLAGTTMGCQTDINGFFSIKKIAPGNYHVVAFALGYDSASVNIVLKSGELLNQKLLISKKSKQLRSVTVSGRKFEKQTNVQISEIQVSATQIKQLPSVGGEPDIAQYLQVLPGVVSSGDQGGQLYIRGGAPVQNKITLDGMTIYNPFHSMGIFSVFETDIIKNADVKTAAFNAENGGATSAVIDITTRDGNRKELTGKISATTFAGKVLLEGPLSKMSETGSGSSSFIITAKSSYLDNTSKLFYKYADTSGKGLPYSFTDLYGKLSFNSATGSKLNLFGFHFADNANYVGVAKYKWTQYGGGADFVITPQGSSTLISGQVSGSQYSLGLTEQDGLPRTTTIGNFGLKMNFLYILENSTNFNYGFELNNANTTDHTYTPLKQLIGDGFDRSSTEIDAYAKYKTVVGKFVLEPGLRLPYYATFNTPTIEPRLGIKYNATSNIRFKFAAGRYSQSLISTKSDRDVVNLFTGFLTTPQEALNNTEKQPVSVNLQKAWHTVAGIEYDVFKNLELSAETYLKEFTQLININRDKVYTSDPDFMVETGNAYGIDLLAKYEYKRFYFWAAYSFAYTNRYDGTKDANGNKVYYPPSFDRRHNINLVSSYTFGKDLNWDFSIRYNFGTGFPFTLTQGYYEQQTFAQGSYTNIITQQGALGIKYDDVLNAGKLPNYIRFDVALKRKFFVGKKGILEANISATNIFDRPNIFYFNRVTAQRVNQLPILPAIGFNYSF